MFLRLASGLLIFFLLGVASTATAQVSPLPPRDRPSGPPPMPVGTSAIKGRVVDAQTGGAVPRARVRLNWMGPAIQRPPVTTDDGGTFAFTGLPAGGFTLTVDKATYLSTRYPEAGQTLRTISKPLMLTEGQVVDNVSVLLYHGGAITGHVVDAHGDPLESAQVQALRLPKSGRGRPQASSMTSTNDLGEFRLARLQPGKYLVLVMPTRQNMFVMPGQPADLVEPQPVATYYPGVLAIDQAQPISVERGASATGVEISLVEGVVAQVSGTLVDAAGQPVTRGGMINVRPIVKDVPGGGLGSSGTSTRPDGTFLLKVPPGEYELEGRVMQMGPGGPQSPGSEQFGSVRLSVSGDVTGVTIPLGPGARVTGRIVFDGTEQVPAEPSNTNGPGRVAFMSTDGPGCRSGRSDVAADWTFTVEGVFGTCTARFNGGIGRWTVKAITHDGKDLMDHPIRFEPGQQLKDVEVILTDKRTELTLLVADEHGTSTREYAAILFSTDKAHWTENSRYVRTYMPPSEQMLSMLPSGSVASAMTFTTTMVNGVVVTGGVGGSGPITGGMLAGAGSGLVPGSMTASGGSVAAPGGSTARKEMITTVPAGDYYIVALDDIDSESARDPETLEQLSRGATRVRLTEGVPADVNLRRLKFQNQNR
jgi:hypothetical protein